eukprot:gnl/Dysnectes_brevis/4935_a6871_662.p1 GENE.gnl/Dysnectes_brevis/4935_a6871_662~~gnl/Dysnectes_brevis/4935_a6871_662.p1  ORF type:complete len:224 (+),score=17.22 gnl/Dysnectes_brevis/4935_a6871_662:79-750(+)
MNLLIPYISISLGITMLLCPFAFGRIFANFQARQSFIFLCGIISIATYILSLVRTSWDLDLLETNIIHSTLLFPFMTSSFLLDIVNPAFYSPSIDVLAVLHHVIGVGGLVVSLHLRLGGQLITALSLDILTWSVPDTHPRTQAVVYLSIRSLGYPLLANTGLRQTLSRISSIPGDTIHHRYRMGMQVWAVALGMWMIFSVVYHLKPSMKCIRVLTTKTPKRSK